MIKNNKGTASIVIVTAVILAASVTKGVYETAKDRTLENNGKVIWCKMKGESAEYCNTTYNYTPKQNDYNFKI